MKIFIARQGADYRVCIAGRKRLLLMDPENRAGLICFQRAQKRRKATEKLG